MPHPLENAKELLATHWSRFTDNNSVDLATEYSDNATFLVSMKDTSNKESQKTSTGPESIKTQFEGITKMLPKDDIEFKAGLTEVFMSPAGPTAFITWSGKDKKNMIEYNVTDTFVANEDGTKWTLQTVQCVATKM